jgi:hypothetical protein
MEIEDLISMLIETTELDEQASIVHYLWLKLGPNYDTRLTNVPGVTVKLLLEGSFFCLNCCKLIKKLLSVIFKLEYFLDRDIFEIVRMP